MVYYFGSYMGGGYFGQSGFNFLYGQVPLYLLIFAVIFIVLAKLLNSAMAALPVAVFVTAATAAYFLLFTTRAVFFGIGDLAVIVGLAVVYAVLARMFYKI